MALSDIASITLTTSGANATRPGYGTPLIMAADCPVGFTERVRFYTSLDGLVVDFAVTTATYRMAAKIFGQETTPPRIAVGRLANKPTQRYAITPTASNSATYSGTLNGLAWSYVSDASATVAEIIAGIKASMDALAQAVTTSDQTTYLRIAANTAGAFHSVSVNDTAGGLLTIAQEHADPGAAADLAAINLENSAWYALLNPFNSGAMAKAVSDWAESNSKLFICGTVDSIVATTSSGSDTTSIAYTARANGRTALMFQQDISQFTDAGLAGRCLPLDAGSETWAFKTLAGVTTSTLTDTQRANLVAKHCGFYETVGGLNLTQEGKVLANEYIDVVRFRDWLQTNMQIDILEALANSDKIPFTDGGIAVIAGKIRGRLSAGIASGGLAASPAPVVNVPRAADVSSGDKAARSLTGVTFTATLAGAIQATTIRGTLSR